MFVDRPVGIDLGTTNSEIALLDPSERDLVIYADRFGRKTIPSVVAWDPKAEAIVVGHAARSRRDKTPPPIESIKRRMGQTTKVSCGPEELAPEEVSAKILAELRARMQESLAGKAPKGVEVKVARAVITVPAYFDAPQIEATRRAGAMAGLDVLGILQEPTAAAIYHTWKSRLGDGNFLVYDLGGGTFDVSVLRCVGGEYQVLAIDGDNYLGGDDFDRRYAEALRVGLVEKGYALDLDVRGDDDDRHRFGRIVHLAQEIKESLSTSEVVHLSRENVVTDKQGEAVAFQADIGRPDYEAVVKDLVETTIACSERALVRSLETASVGIADIDHVVLVGGSTRVPLVVRRVAEALASKCKSKVILEDEVDTCVALGAAVHAAQLGGLGVGDPAQRMSVVFTTPLVADSPKLRLGVRVVEAPDGAMEIAVLRGDAVLARGPIPGTDAVVRLDVKLGDDREDGVRVAALSHTGAVIASIPFTLYRGDVRPRASALSRPSVVAKDIALEIVRAGRRERRVLIARGAGLPTEITHRFFTADQSGAIVLRLLQNRLPIKTLFLEVPKDLVVGTAVDLTLRCDEAMRLEARADVAGQKLWAQIEPAEAARFDHRSDVDALLEEAEAAGRALWGSHANAYRSESEKLIAGIREVVAIDPDKLGALCQRLRSLIDEFRGGPNEELAPPMHHFESELDGLRRVVYRAPGSLLGMDRATWDARIAEIEERALEAFRASDAIGWRRSFNEVQALYETAFQEEFAGMRLDDPLYLARRLSSVITYANRVERSLIDFVPSATDEVRARQVAECERLVATLREKVTSPLTALSVDDQTDAAALRRTLEQMSAELSRIEGAVERIPALGLVTERAG